MPEVVTALLHALANPEVHVRSMAAMVLGQLGVAAATPEVVTALLRALADSEAHVREAAAGALEQLGAAAATPEVVTALLHTLADSEAHVREVAASGLQRLLGYVRLPDRSTLVNLVLPLARSNDAESRDVGYVSLRNLLATEPVVDMSPALIGLSE